MRIRRGLSLVCLLVLLSPRLSDAGPLVSSEPADIQAFDLLTQDDGWVLAGGRLYLTGDSGITWSDRTPGLGTGLPCNRPRLSVAFPDPLTGRALLTCPAPSGRGSATLARTTDGGRSWSLLPLPKGVADAFPVPTGAAHLFFLDARRGWLAVDQLTGSNFALGRLFVTSDGGVTWSQVEVPVGGDVVFADAQRGWAAGGAAGEALYHTTDGGLTWTKASFSLTHEETRPEAAIVSYQLPTVRGDGSALLALSLTMPAGSSVRYYLLDASGANSQLVLSLPAVGDVSPGTAVPLAAPDAKGWLTVLPGGGTLLRIEPSDGGASPWSAVPVSRGPLVASMRRLDMAGGDTGWALARSGDCDPGCHQDTALLLTSDGGATWSRLSLPAEEGTSAGTVSPFTAGACREQSGAEAKGEDSSPVRTRTGQGFDTCNAPSLAALEVWSHHSPYRTINLYIGGANRACNNLRLTRDYVEQASAQGWSLIPTWVGPQAACWGGQATRMSYDPAIAYAQGVAEADAALEAATALGLATPGEGTVLYYDLEAYNTGDTACREAAKSFIQGWTERLQALDQVAGVYGAGCASAPSDWATLPSPPDALWAAHWIYDSFTPEATVWDVACLPNSLWADQQRLRQYTGGHDEVWGGTNLTIDCDVLAGMVIDLREIWRCGENGPCWHVYLPEVSAKMR